MPGPDGPPWPSPSPSSSRWRSSGPLKRSLVPGGPVVLNAAVPLLGTVIGSAPAALASAAHATPVTTAVGARQAFRALFPSYPRTPVDPALYPPPSAGCQPGGRPAARLSRCRPRRRAQPVAFLDREPDFGAAFPDPPWLMGGRQPGLS